VAGKGKEAVSLERVGFSVRRGHETITETPSYDRSARDLRHSSKLELLEAALDKLGCQLSVSPKKEDEALAWLYPIGYNALREHDPHFL
jgi:hypothetical protein